MPNRGFGLESKTHRVPEATLDRRCGEAGQTDSPEPLFRTNPSPPQRRTGNGRNPRMGRTLAEYYQNAFQF